MKILTRSAEPSSIKVGTTDVSAVYVGSEKAWPSFVFDPVAFFSSTTWVAPVAGTYKFHLIGGGGNNSRWSSPYYGAGGGSGRYATADVDLSAGQSVTITVGPGGSTGGTTSITVGGSTVASATGGTQPPGSGRGGAGGSGGGGAPTDANFKSARGGWHGANGESGAASGGNGQSGVSFNMGTNPLIPPGGCSSYANASATAYYDGIAGFGAGAQASQNQDGICAGGGAGGANWGHPSRTGKAGMVVIE